MSDLFTMLGTLISNIIDWIEDFVGAITGNQFILFFVGLSLVGIAVGFISRLIKVRR